MLSLVFDLGHHNSYPANTMARMSLKSLLILVSLVAVCFVPLSIFIHHLTTWGPAERTSEMLAELFHDAHNIGNADITLDEINALLETPKFAFLKQHRTYDIERRDGELAWFSPNSRYSIGLTREGWKLWVINGKREGD